MSPVKSWSIIKDQHVVAILSTTDSYFKIRIISKWKYGPTCQILPFREGDFPGKKREKWETEEVPG